MYKVIPFLLLFFTFAFGGSALASNDYKNGLLDVVEFSSSHSLVLFDNSLETRITEAESNNLVTINLEDEVNINSIFLQYDRRITTPINGTLTYEFFSDNGNLIDTFITPNTTNLDTGYYFDIPRVNNVKKITIKNNHAGRLFQEFDFFGDVVEKKIYKNIENLTEIHNFNSVSFSWDMHPNISDLKNIVFKQNGLEVAKIAPDQENYTIANLIPETEYTFEIFVEYLDGVFSDSETLTLMTSIQPDDINPPGEITDLAFGVSSIGVIFDWVNPPDTDFSHVRIYRDNQLIEASHTLNTFNDTNLIPNTIYLYKFVTVDNDGNNSLGFIQTVKTTTEKDNEAPLAPIGFSVTNGNGSGFLKWTKNTEADLLGYNIYVDGIKHNTSPVMSTNYVISNLTNEQSYSLNISAVDTSSNESVLSEPIILEPFAGGMPVFEIGYDLKAVSDGTSVWFFALWPILAFAVGIVLAFIISHRVKGLILS